MTRIRLVKDAAGKSGQGETIDLEAALAELRRLAPKPSPDIINYLVGVYRLRLEVASDPELGKALQALHAKHCPRTLKEYTAAILELTGGDYITTKKGRGKKNKYFGTLQYAKAQHVDPADLINFIRKNGNINGCAEKWSRTTCEK